MSEDLPECDQTSFIGRIVRTFISIPLAILFVFLAGFNVWIMLRGPGTSPRARQIWTQVHRVCGYVFISLFVIFCYFMFLRIRSADELSPRIVLHVSLALVLAPLLLAKVFIVRYQKSAWNVIMVLGVAIFVGAFALVSMNVAVHFLRDLPSHKIPPYKSLIGIIATVAAAAISFLTKSKEQTPKTTSRPTVATSSTEEQLSSKDKGKVLNLTLSRIESQTHDAKTLRFVLAENQEISAKPGQFLTFDWMIEGQLVKRPYTICSSATQRGFIEITPKRVENGYVSKFLNDQAAVGMTAKARGPYGTFCFDDMKHKRIVLIAGGSGITPMIAMLRYIDDRCLKVHATLIYCVRTERDVIFEDELSAIQKRLPDFRHVTVFSQPVADARVRKGRLSREILEREIAPPLDYTFFLCGPPQFMDRARSILTEMGVKPSDVLQESFGGGVSSQTTSGRSVSETAPGPLAVKLSHSGLTYRISSEGNVLENLEQNGVLIPSGCRQGRCGTCATKLLGGNVQMENEEALTDEMRAQGFILPCVSRPLSDLTLDA